VGVATAETTRILADLANGDGTAAERLLPLVYDELRALAAKFMAAESPGHTFQPTALANDAYLRLIDQSNTDWKNRAHFFALASRIIRRILVDHARGRAALKRGGDQVRVPFEGRAADHGLSSADLLALDEALEELGRLNDRHRRIVEMRYFGGLTIEETARVLEVSPQTVKADWALARAWLRVQLEG
jgi:RNA polymerase sigma factor (TIGR02999 family)